MIFDPTSYREIEEWNVSHLATLPSAESDRIEYKSSKVKVAKLGAKISVAASAFWNTGGGLLVLGVDPKTGLPDGGLSPSDFGRQSIRDWIDQAIAETEPIGPYTIHIILGEEKDESIQRATESSLSGLGAAKSLPTWLQTASIVLGLVPTRLMLVTISSRPCDPNVDRISQLISLGTSKRCHPDAA